MTDTREPSKSYYAIGFAFNHNASKVVLIRKNRPVWQAGKLNGVGGKIEPGEKPIDAMIREFHEECGVTTNPSDWHYFTKIITTDAEMFCYRLFDDNILTAKTLSDEEIILSETDLNSLQKTGTSQLAWLIAIALDETLPHSSIQANYNQGFLAGKTGS